MNAATASLDLYEQNKNLRMNFFFHEEALRHLTRLTRVFVNTAKYYVDIDYD